MPENPQFPIDPIFQAQKRELEEQETRAATFFTKTRTIFLDEHELNVTWHEKPRKAAERCRALAIYMTIVAEALERVDDLRRHIHGKTTKTVTTERNSDAKTRPDSSSSKEDGAAGGNILPIDIRATKNRKD